MKGAPLELPIACLITKGEAVTENFPQKKLEILDMVEAAVRNGIGMVQVREKRLPAKLLFELVVGAVKTARNSDTRILVNGRADIAAAAGADGVHLPANSLSADVIRKNFPDLRVGVSTHTSGAAEEAARQGAAYAFFGPVFDTPGKGPARGLEKLGDVCAKLTPFPVIALGGIDVTNYESILAAGSSGIAAIRFLNDPENMKIVGRGLQLFPKDPLEAGIKL